MWEMVTQYAFKKIFVRVLKSMDDALMEGTFNLHQFGMHHNHFEEASDDDGLHDEDGRSDIDPLEDERSVSESEGE
ncbi:hypothetical protein RIF29_25329 [Crotalaria pallida]|uniref:Uncharacterized protein n=1 Tax=Crotalaria pallida TaxID=3830 RepID=A0AAN9EM32_CROPI